MLVLLPLLDADGVGSIDCWLMVMVCDGAVIG